MSSSQWKRSTIQDDDFGDTIVDSCCGWVTFYLLGTVILLVSSFMTTSWSSLPPIVGLYMLTIYSSWFPVYTWFTGPLSFVAANRPRCDQKLLVQWLKPKAGGLWLYLLLLANWLYVYNGVSVVLIVYQRLGDEWMEKKK